MPHPTLPVPAIDYIPQRPPIVMIDNILESNDDHFSTDFVILSDNVFVDDGQFRESGLMENIAQTCAARVSFCAEDQRVPRGVIGGISKFQLYALPAVGDRIVTTIRVVAGIENALVVDAEVHCGDNLCATSSMKVFISD